ncbi:zinc finger protein RFP-like, partial [Diretmus argenteus]
IDPVWNLGDRMCEKHNKLTELYCRTDQSCICVLCMKTDHKSHNVVPLEEEYEAAAAKINETIEKVQEMIHSPSEKITEMERSVDISNREAEEEAAATVEVFTDLICSIQKNQDELLEVIKERHEATKQKTEGFVKELKLEITELERRRTKLESEDHHPFLQSFSTMCSPLKKDWKNISVDSNLSVGKVRGAVSLLKKTIDIEMEQLPDIKLKRMKEHAVDVTLDPNTAHCELFLSQDGKQVTHVDTRQNFPKNPKRFERFPDVLGKEGFKTENFYYEVQVKGKTEWTVGGEYKASLVKIKLKEKLQKVGVFVDLNKGEVSFYDVDSKSHIYSFTGYYFKEKLYPYFNSQSNYNGTNSAPLIITPRAQSWALRGKFLLHPTPPPRLEISRFTAAGSSGAQASVIAPSAEVTELKTELRSIERLIEELLHRQTELSSRLSHLEPVAGPSRAPDGLDPPSWSLSHPLSVLTLPAERSAPVGQ